MSETKDDPLLAELRLEREACKTDPQLAGHEQDPRIRLACDYLDQAAELLDWRIADLADLELEKAACLLELAAAAL